MFDEKINVAEIMQHPNAITQGTPHLSLYMMQIIPPRKRWMRLIS